MVTTKTRRELVQRALSDLGVIRAGQAPNDEDASAVDALVPSVIAMLEQRELVYISDVERIDASVFLPVSILLANAASAEFGGAKLDIEGAEKALREIGRSGPTYETLEADYF